MIFKSAEKSLISFLFTQLVFLTPTFTIGVASVVTYSVLFSVLMQVLKLAEDGEHIRDLVTPIGWTCSGTFFVYILMHREIKR